MRQGIEFLKYLSPEEQVLFLKNLNNIGGHKISEYLLCEYNSLYDFVMSSFTFSSSPEGHSYWSEIIYRKDTI